jgi:hypothetical protein
MTISFETVEAGVRGFRIRGFRVSVADLFVKRKARTAAGLPSTRPRYCPITRIAGSSVVPSVRVQSLSLTA